MEKLLANGEVVGAIERGLCLLIGIHRHDTLEDAEKLINKILKLRLWSEDTCHWKRNVCEIEQGGILAISQFTLLANTDKGSKPDFHNAMATEDARRLFGLIVERIREKFSGTVQTGAFGQMMKVEIVNDGPVTIVFDSKDK